MITNYFFLYGCWGGGGGPRQEMGVMAMSELRGGGGESSNKAGPTASKFRVECTLPGLGVAVSRHKSAIEEATYYNSS